MPREYLDMAVDHGFELADQTLRIYVKGEWLLYAIFEIAEILDFNTHLVLINLL